REAMARHGSLDVQHLLRRGGYDLCSAGDTFLPARPLAMVVAHTFRLEPGVCVRGIPSVARMALRLDLSDALLPAPSSFRVLLGVYDFCLGSDWLSRPSELD